jgi:hypothetical protein
MADVGGGPRAGDEARQSFGSSTRSNLWPISESPIGSPPQFSLPVGIFFLLSATELQFRLSTLGYERARPFFRSAFC